METDAVRAATKSGRIEELIGARRIVGVLSDVRIEGPMVWGQQAGGQAGLPVEQVFNERFAIGGVSESLPHFTMRENRILEIERDIGQRSAGLFFHREPRHICERGRHVRRKRIDLDVRRAFAQFERANDGVRNDSETHALDFRGVSKIIGIAFEHDLLVANGADEAKWSAADGALRHSRVGISGDDANTWARESEKE